jgi:SAM-dependent methyltransferase
MSEYVDYAEYYDYDPNPKIDLDFYLEYAKLTSLSRGPILELACGTGRLAIPIAEAGFEIYGLDLSANMLALCRAKVESKNLTDSVHLSLANIAEFDLPRVDFTLAFIAVRSFMHLFTQQDQISCLRSVYKHLNPGGLFIIDIYAPNYEKLAEKPDQPFAYRKEFDLPDDHHVVRYDRFIKNDLKNQIQHSEIRFEEFDQTGTLIRERTLPLDTRYTFRYELQLLLEKTGFEVLEVYRDYDKNPYDGTGEIIMVAQRGR